MNKLEDKIINRIYKLETKKTFSYMLSRVFFIFLFIFLFFVFTSVTVDILNEQRSFDLLVFFRDDFEVMKKYFTINLMDFFQEMPQPLTLVSLITLAVLSIAVFMLIRNFNKIKNKLISIYKFYKKL